MNNITKTRSLIVIIIFLLVTNIAMLVFFILLNKPVDKRPKSREQGGSMYNSLQNEIGFSQDQLAQYQVLRKKQRESVRPLFGELRSAKKDFYELVYSSTVSDSLINADADSIAQKQKTLDLQMFRYFRNLRSICTPDQLQKFDSTIKKVVIRMVVGPERSGKDNSAQKK